MDGFGKFVAEWAGTLTTLALVGVTIWYAVQTQRMARSARDSTRYARDAAESSARAASIAAAGTRVSFDASPTFIFDGAWKSHFSGVQLVCKGANMYVHTVAIIDAWATASGSPPIDIEERQIFDDGAIPALAWIGDDRPLLMHRDENVFLELAGELPVVRSVSTLEVRVTYSFDGQRPFRSRTAAWEDLEGDSD